MLKEKKGSLLLIEDNPVLTDIYEIAFRQKGIEVTVAHEGESGLRLAREKHPQVILLDLLMPGKSGFDVLQALRENDTTKDIKVIVFTALDDKKSQEKAKKLGVVAYFVKSKVDPQELVECVLKHFSAAA